MPKPQCVIAILISMVVARADAHVVPDSLSEPEPKQNLLCIDNDGYGFSPRRLITPVIFIAAGYAGVYALPGLKEGIRNDMNRLRGDHYFHADDYIQYLPIVAYASLGFMPIRHKNEFVARLMAGATAYAALGIMVNLLKPLVLERRPDSSRRNSFPSGHTATAFMGAELMRIEYGDWIGCAGYAVACGIGFLRMYNERHWYNDVLAGAGIGILSARIGYWLLPLEEKQFKIRNGVIAPYYDQSGHLGMACVFKF